MKEEIEGLYAKGVASPGGPRHAAASARVSPKRWQGLRAGGLLSHEINHDRGADTVVPKWKATPPAAPARAASGPRGVEEPFMHGTFMRENRGVPSLPVSRSRGGGPLRVVNADVLAHFVPGFKRRQAPSYPVTRSRSRAQLTAGWRPIEVRLSVEVHDRAETVAAAGYRVEPVDPRSDCRGEFRFTRATSQTESGQNEILSRTAYSTESTSWRRDENAAYPDVGPAARA
jgi:hypothetical protein